jgi:putative ABC transport system permease protein
MSLRDNWGDGAELYVPLDRGRFRESLAGPRATGGVYRTFLLRTADDDPKALVADVRRAVWGVDPAQPIERLLPLDEAYGGTIERENFFLALLATFAVLAGALAAAGVYALLSRSLARRTRELGIRVALGARPGQVLARLARGGIGPSLAGVALGVAVAWPLSSLLGDLLFEVAPGDPLTLALTAAALLAVAVVACVPPARRALRTDVVEAIRSE